MACLSNRWTRKAVQIIIQYNENVSLPFQWRYWVRNERRSQMYYFKFDLMNSFAEIHKKKNNLLRYGVWWTMDIAMELYVFAANRRKKQLEDQQTFSRFIAKKSSKKKIWFRIQYNIRHSTIFSLIQAFCKPFFFIVVKFRTYYLELRDYLSGLSIGLLLMEKYENM